MKFEYAGFGVLRERVHTVMVVAVKARVAVVSFFCASAVAAASRETSRFLKGTAVARPAARRVKRVETSIVEGDKECVEDKDRRDSDLQRKKKDWGGKPRAQRGKGERRMTKHTNQVELLYSSGQSRKASRSITDRVAWSIQNSLALFLSFQLQPQRSSLSNQVEEQFILPSRAR